VALVIWPGRGVDVPNNLQQAGPGESEEVDRWDPAVEFFFGLKHFEQK
jgi:hypothetical protein